MAEKLILRREADEFNELLAALEVRRARIERLAAGEKPCPWGDVELVQLLARNAALELAMHDRVIAELNAQRARSGDAEG